MEERRFCRKCLTKEMPDSAYYENMYDYIARLDENIKASEEVYQTRLSACKQCDSLLNGMCRVCGCFVELRAAITRNQCPAVSPKW
ncbi:MAG: DUF6171 family protein [Lachnospiraceae bacterium]|nr:DUF6171 family protein [Lachnospiraceae bacterium]